MSIFKDHIDYEKFVRNEHNTLCFLHTDPYVKEQFPNLATKAELTYYSYKGKIKRIAQNPYEFCCGFELEVEKKLRKVFVEFLISPNYSIATYMLGICESEGDAKDLIRKFHFDFAPPIEGQEKKPVYHLQYGGRATPELSRQDISVDHLKPWLSAPRINFTPINLALLLDLLFTEFKSEKTHDLSERREWRDLIKKNEDQLLIPFYKGLNHFIINGNHKSTYLLRDFCYGI